MIEQHRAQPQALNGKTVREIINQEHAYEIGLRLGRQERAHDHEHQREMARLMNLEVAQDRKEEHRLLLTLRVQNKSAKSMRRFDSAIEVHDFKGARVGLAEFQTPCLIAGHSSQTLTVPVSYLRFGEDAGSMRLARGRATRVLLQVKEITYADGSDAGFDD